MTDAAPESTLRSWRTLFELIAIFVGVSSAFFVENLRQDLEERERLASPEQQYDILYADITADWEDAMTGVYAFLDRPFTDAAKQGMRGWLNENRQHKHGAHKYNLEQFGLTADQVDMELMFYRERFQIPYETANPHTTANSNR